MSLYARTATWVEQIKAVMRGNVALDEKLFAELSESAPCLALAVKAGHTVLDKIHSFVAAREALVQMGGQFFRAAYEFHLQDLAATINGIDDQTLKTALLAEIRNFGHFVEPSPLLLKELPTLAREASPVLDTIDTAILRTSTAAFSVPADPSIGADLRTLWAHYLKVVSPNATQEWKDILKTVRDALGGLEGGKLRRFGAADELQFNSDSYRGYLTAVAGKMFEAYAFRSPELAVIFEDALNGADRLAARLNGTAKKNLYQRFRTGSKLELAVLDPEKVAAVEQTGVFPDSLHWLQFADDSTAAVRFPTYVPKVPGSSANSGIGDIVFSTLFQAKRTGRAGDFVVQNEKDLLRLWDDSFRGRVFARVQQPSGGGFKKTICLVSQPSISGLQPLTFYRIAASDTIIPSSAELAAIGVTQKSVNLWPSNQMLRELADVFLSAGIGLK